MDMWNTVICFSKAGLREIHVYKQLVQFPLFNIYIAVLAAYFPSRSQTSEQMDF